MRKKIKKCIKAVAFLEIDHKHGWQEKRNFFSENSPIFSFKFLYYFWPEFEWL